MFFCNGLLVSAAWLYLPEKQPPSAREQLLSPRLRVGSSENESAACFLRGTQGEEERARLASPTRVVLTPSRQIVYGRVIEAGWDPSHQPTKTKASRPGQHHVENIATEVYRMRKAADHVGKILAF